jgi:hypothetical protein
MCLTAASAAAFLYRYSMRCELADVNDFYLIP